jgi:hypothetical protein
MVPVVTASNEIHAQIIGARLGAEGFLWELQPSVGAPYSVGSVGVLVEQARVEEARELLLVDEVEAVFDDADTAEASDGSLWLLVVAVLVLLTFVAVRLMSLT